ncbi:MAG: SMP-30/gluconolactonase/LRE family protein [Pseudomonadota bacterium]
MINIERISTIKNALGEGPVWDAGLQSLFWLDSFKGQIFCLGASGEIQLWPMPCMIGSLAIVDDSRAIVALQTGFHFFNFVTNELTSVADPEAEIIETRFNDGKTDRAGNFVAGSMGIKIRDRALAHLYRVNSDLSIEVLDDDVIVSNGPCFSPEGDILYFNDGRRRMLAYDYVPDKPLTNKRVFFEGAAHNTGSDGATVDKEGNVWTALTGSSEVGCISPQGKILERIPMPIKLPSSVMFGGPELNELYVTSISNSGNRTSDEEGAGGLYKITGLGATGIAEPRFNCITL